MSLIFQGSDKPSLGVEIELQIIDPESLDLSPQSEKILDLCKQEGIVRVTTEIHQSMVEVNSEISENVKECRKFLNTRMHCLNNIVEDLGLQLAITGTHPFQRWSERLISKTDRYQTLHKKYQWLARRMNVYGMHVHVGVSSGERALAICQAMIQYLPHLLALSANSPFWQGIDTGMESSRVNILDAFPFCGLPQPITKWEEFEHYYNTLTRVGAIRSCKDLYWYVRPNLVYGTVEIRICDAMNTLDETMALVALIQCLVVKIDEELDQGTPIERPPEFYWIAPENQWIAARDGLEGKIIVDLQGKKQKISNAVLELTQLLSPIAERLDCQEELSCLTMIIKNGNGARRQRAIYNKTHSLRKVVAYAQEEFISSLQEEHLNTNENKTSFAELALM